MNALPGRKVFIRKGSGSPQVLLAAGRTKTITPNATPLDISSDDDSGWRTFIEDEAGLRSVDISFEGVTKNADLINAIMSGNFVDDYEIEIEGIGVFNGRFFVTSTPINAPYNEPCTFTAEFQSTGEVTFTKTDSP